LNQAIQTHRQQLVNTNNTFASTQATLSITDVATNLQNIRLESLSTAVQSGQASSQVAAAFTQPVDRRVAPALTAVEMNAQLESGDLYVNSRGQFFLNRQPTNARDASVAAFVIGGNRLNDKLNDLMNKVNVNNTKIQIANYLSAATSAADLQTRIADQKAQYGFADLLSEITGGALSDADINAGTDVSGATGTFQSTLKTAINNASKNQDLDTQSLQSLTSQIQANNTAMTQMIQAFEQLLKSLAQNLV
jgi:ribosomal protein L22